MTTLMLQLNAFLFPNADNAILNKTIMHIREVIDNEIQKILIENTINL